MMKKNGIELMIIERRKVRWRGWKNINFILIRERQNGASDLMALWFLN
jgi:hypothetical protein